VEDSLRESEERYAQLAEQGSTVAWEVDAQGLYTYVSQVSGAVWGYRPDELVGRKHFYDLHPESVREASKASAFTVFARKQPFLNFVNALQTKDGRHVWVSTNGTPILNPEGTLLGYRGSDTDITERKRAEDNLATALEFHKQLLENAPALIWRAGTDAKCEWFNTTWLEFTGRTMEQELGNGWAEGVHAEDFDRCLKLYLDAFAARRPFHMDYRLRRPDGTYSWISDFGIPLTDGLSGDFCGYIGYCFDIMDLKSMEERLNESLVAANAANRAKNEFLNVMSHELRTPLNGVLGFAQLLSDTLLDNEQHSFVKTISSSGEHLLAIVNDILDFASIDAGALAIHAAPLAVADLVKTAESTVRITAADKGLELRCEFAAGVPEQITGDEQRIRQILINLLGNAVKFTASGSVVLRVTRSGEFLDFSVEDTGIGISSETLDRLFQPFVQADSKMSRPFGGTGLGLSISRRIAEAMGGAITVASTPAKGSTFTFRLPLEVSAGGTAAVTSQLFPGANGASPSRPGA
jgi:two-component system CheB/CheR fusion protein